MEEENGNLIISRRPEELFYLDIEKSDQDMQVKIKVLPHKNGQCRFSIKAPKNKVHIWRDNVKKIRKELKS